MRMTVDIVGGRRHSGVFQCFDHNVVTFFIIRADLVQLQHAHEDFFNRIPRIERIERVLENHLTGPAECQPVFLFQLGAGNTVV